MHCRSRARLRILIAYIDGNLTFVRSQIPRQDRVETVDFSRASVATSEGTGEVAITWPESDDVGTESGVLTIPHFATGTTKVVHQVCRTADLIASVQSNSLCSLFLAPNSTLQSGSLTLAGKKKNRVPLRMAECSNWSTPASRICDGSWEISTVL